MAAFKAYYRAMYRIFGYPLTLRTATPLKELNAAEKRLGVRIPTALRDYYLVAGRERRFSTSHNRLLPPQDWTVDQRRIIFMEENQVVVLWGVSTRNPSAIDPPVSQGSNDEPITWYPEHQKCSVFLAVMLHYQAVCGGFRFIASGELEDPRAYRFEDHGWTYHGEVNSMRAYSRPNQVVCLMPPGDAPWSRGWSINAGGKTQRDLEAIGSELGVDLEEL